ELKKICPDIKVILTSGYNENDAPKKKSEDLPAAFIQKPYQLSELKEKIESVLKNESPAKNL
ncbi:MAG: hypothetical protein HQK78_13370, partial [Desulfobacterales bacterium]|nr:hypothetical protein [Desulfobacterales bacterium]